VLPRNQLIAWYLMTHTDQKTLMESSTIPNFAKRHSLSLSTVYRLIKDGDVPVTKIRGLSRILLADEVSWIDSLRKTPHMEG
jgi:predicted DNA-binding transcriptional regulator AlpA